MPHRDTFSMRVRLFWADMQRVFLFPLLIILAVYFFTRLNALDANVAEHHALPGHLNTTMVASEARIAADNLADRVDRLERIVNHKVEK